MRKGVIGSTLGALLFALSFSAEAQQPTKHFRIGVLSSRLGPMPTREGTFQEGLRKLGYVEGQNISIEYRYAEEKLDRIPGLVAELVDSSNVRRARVRGRWKSR
jgi:putative ABC transport system substrate-binding protein